MRSFREADELRHLLAALAQQDTRDGLSQRERGSGTVKAGEVTPREHELVFSDGGGVGLGFGGLDGGRVGLCGMYFFRAAGGQQAQGGDSGQNGQDSFSIHGGTPFRAGLALGLASFATLPVL